MLCFPCLKKKMCAHSMCTWWLGDLTQISDCDLRDFSMPRAVPSLGCLEFALVLNILVSSEQWWSRFPVSASKRCFCKLLAMPPLEFQSYKILHQDSFIPTLPKNSSFIRSKALLQLFGTQGCVFYFQQHQCFVRSVMQKHLCTEVLVHKKRTLCTFRITPVPSMRVSFTAKVQHLSVKSDQASQHFCVGESVTPH